MQFSRNSTTMIGLRAHASADNHPVSDLTIRYQRHHLNVALEATHHSLLGSNSKVGGLTGFNLKVYISKPNTVLSNISPRGSVRYKLFIHSPTALFPMSEKSSSSINTDFSEFSNPPARDYRLHNMSASQRMSLVRLLTNIRRSRLTFPRWRNTKPSSRCNSIASTLSSTYAASKKPLPSLIRPMSASP